MDDIRPLYIWPWPLTTEDRLALRNAKEALGVPYKVQPQEATVHTTGRVLALRERPQPLCDHALVRDVDNQVSVMEAMEWAVTTKRDPRATTLLQQLQLIIPGITEVSENKLAFENASINLDLNDMRVRFK